MKLTNSVIKAVVEIPEGQIAYGPPQEYYNTANLATKCISIFVPLIITIISIVGMCVAIKKQKRVYVVIAIIVMLLSLIGVCYGLGMF